MAKIIKEWTSGSVSIAVEAGRDDANREGAHVHIYKRGRRTSSRIPGRNLDLDTDDFNVAEELYDRNYNEIRTLCDEVANGKYDT